MESDNKIWDDFRKGEKYALSHIYYQYVELLFRYGKKFSNDGDLVKDTIQDLFYDLIRTRKNLGATDNIRFYLMRSFRRKLVHKLKKDQLSQNFGNHDPEPTIVYSVEEEYMASESVSKRDQVIQNCLQELNPRQREILYYRFICNLEYEEVCELMSLKYDSARKLVHRALKSLKNMLNENNITGLSTYFQIGSSSGNEDN
ncbi:MAG: ECF subfamily RNA polymerase sigma-24 [Prolixibacteraceae bacterium]|nr:MAG: ECF subfamily RNA polymerase sigma-24 [Prolixibacteraceae bacterium]